MNVGIIGAGGIARKLHLPQLADLEGVRVTHLAGRKPSRLKQLCEEFNVPHWSSDHRDLLNDPSVDAVVIALPHPLHVPVGLDALAAGKHVLMQKPLCSTMTDADAFVTAAERSDRIVLALPHYGPDAYAARSLACSGAIGKLSGAHCRVSHGGPEVYYAEIRDYFGEDPGDLWFFREGDAAVGALFDMGVYAVGVLITIMGSVASVMGQAATIDKDTTLEDTATLILRFRSGAIGSAETGWCDPARSFQLSVHGTRGKITCPGVAGGATRWEPGSYTREDVPATPHDIDVGKYALGNAHEYWLECIRRSRNPEISSPRYARHITEVLLAGIESSRTGRAIEIASTVD